MPFSRHTRGHVKPLKYPVMYFCCLGGFLSVEVAIILPSIYSQPFPEVPVDHVCLCDLCEPAPWQWNHAQSTYLWNTQIYTNSDLKQFSFTRVH